MDQFLIMASLHVCVWLMIPSTYQKHPQPSFVAPKHLSPHPLNWSLNIITCQLIQSFDPPLFTRRAIAPLLTYTACRLQSICSSFGSVLPQFLQPASHPTLIYSYHPTSAAQTILAYFLLPPSPQSCKSRHLPPAGHSSNNFRGLPSLTNPIAISHHTHTLSRLVSSSAIAFFSSFTQTICQSTS